MMVPRQLGLKLSVLMVLDVVFLDIFFFEQDCLPSYTVLDGSFRSVDGTVSTLPFSRLPGLNCSLLGCFDVVIGSRIDLRFLNIYKQLL